VNERQINNMDDICKEKKKRRTIIDKTKKDIFIITNIFRERDKTNEK